MSLFGSSNTNQPNRLFGMPIQQSILGKPIPIVYGQNRLSGQVIWYGDWHSFPAPQAGKSGFGKGASGKGGAQLNYGAAIMIALCQGPIAGIHSIWIDKAQLLVRNVTEIVTIPANGGVVTPVNLSGFISDVGVGFVSNFSLSANDHGSPGPTTLTGTQLVPLAVTDTAPLPGSYQLLSEVGGIYVTDTGFGYAPDPYEPIPTVLIDPPPPGGSQATAEWVWLTRNLPSGPSGFSGPGTQIKPNDYVISVTNPGSGYDFKNPPKVTVTPPVTIPISQGGRRASAIVNLIDTYNFSAADGNKTVQITYKFYQITNSETQGQVVPQQNLNLILFNGSNQQQPWPYMTANHPAQAIGYTQTAYVANQNMDLSSSGLISNYSFEVAGLIPNPVGGNVVDVEPTSIIFDFLTNTHYGAGMAPHEIGDLTEVKNYNTANGLFISPVIDTQKAAREWVAEWLKVSNSAAVWSDGVLKLRCYGDKTVAGNGAIYTPNTTPIYDLDDDAYIATGTDDPLKVQRPSVRDAENQISIEWANRGNNYRYEPIYDQDDFAIRNFGLKPRSPDSLHCITSQPVAQKVANTELLRSVYIRNTYTAKLDAVTYSLLEPMDLLTLNDLGLGLVDHPVRIVTIEEDDNFQYTVTCEDFPWSAASPTLHPKQHIADAGPGYFSPPGPVNAPFFLPIPPEISQGNEFVMGIALSGGQEWGGADVFVSTNGPTGPFNLVGRQLGSATMGFLTTALPASVDPDTTNVLSVDLTESSGPSKSVRVDTVAKNQADSLISLVAVEQELIAYYEAHLTAPFTYNFTGAGGIGAYLRRGAYNSPINNHAINAPFCLVDQSLFEWQYDASVVESTVWFKFCSFNLAGQREEELDKVAVYQFFVTGPRVAYPWSPGGVSPLNGDAVFPQGSLGAGGNFDLQPYYTVDASQNGVVYADIIGNPPIADFSVSIVAPIISCTVGTTGSIPPGTYVVAVSGFDAPTNTAYHNTALSNFVLVTIPPGPSNGIIHVTVTWPPNDFGGDVYIAIPNEAFGWHYQAHLSAHAPSVDISTIFLSSSGAPDGNFDHFGVDIFQVVHGGNWAAQVTARTANTLTFGGNGMTTNQWAGYICSLYAKTDTTKTIPILNMPVVSSTASSGGLFTLTIGPNSASVQLPDLTTLIDSNDVIVMRFKGIFTANGFSDANIANPISGDGTGFAIAPQDELGLLAVVLTGADSGDVRQIASNTRTSVTLTSAWKIQPTTGDVVIIVAPVPSPSYKTHTLKVPNKVTFNGVVARANVVNLANSSWLFRVGTEDQDDFSGPNELKPMRDAYFFGKSGGISGADTVVSVINTNVTLLPAHQIVNVTATTVDCIVTLPSEAPIPGDPTQPGMVGLTIVLNLSPGSTHSLIIRDHTGDTIGGSASDYVFSVPGGSIIIEGT